MPSTSSDIESIAAEIAPRMIWLQIVHLALVASVAVFLVVMLAQGSAAMEDRSSPGFHRREPWLGGSSGNATTWQAGAKPTGHHTTLWPP